MPALCYTFFILSERKKIMCYQPKYAEHFSCLASGCPDTCCAGWEIVIDEATERCYRTLDGAIGKEVRRVMTADEDGDTVFTQCGKRCPFLNEQNLCRLRMALGWEYTSEICREHPRFTEEYDGFTEYSLSLSCPAVCRLVFSSPIAGTYPPIQAQSPDEVLNLLTQSRNALFRRLDETEDIFQNIRSLFEASAAVQNRIAELEADAPFAEEIREPDEADTERFCRMLLEACEILTDQWRELLTNSRQKQSFADMALFAAGHNVCINRAFAYFVYRYFLKSVNHLDCLATARFIALSTLAPVRIACLTNTPLEEVYRLYSKEIEHDTVNLDLLFSAL